MVIALLQFAIHEIKLVTIRAVKRNVKRRETKPISGEMRDSVFAGLRFTVLTRVFIGGTRPKTALVSHFTPIPMKFETR